MTLRGKRVLLRCLLIGGILLCLTPFFANMWVTWKYVFNPLVVSGGRDYKPPDQFQLQMEMRSDPVFKIAVLGIAPVGLVMTIYSLVQLRRLRVEPPPPLPDDYGLGGMGR